MRLIQPINLRYRGGLFVLLLMFATGSVFQAQEIIFSDNEKFVVRNSNEIIAYFNVIPELKKDDQTEILIDYPKNAAPTFTLYKKKGSVFNLCPPCSGKDISISPTGNPRLIIPVHVTGVNSEESWKLVISNLGDTGVSIARIKTTTQGKGSSEFTGLHIVPTVDTGPEKVVTTGEKKIKIGGDNSHVNVWNVTPNPALTYSWKQTGGSNDVMELGDTNRQKLEINFLKPFAADPLTFELTVNDGTLSNKGNVKIVQFISRDYFDIKPDSIEFEVTEGFPVVCFGESGNMRLASSVEKKIVVSSSSKKINWEIAGDVSDNRIPWLSVSPTKGVTPQLVSVFFIAEEIKKLSAGNYHAAVVFKAQDSSLQIEKKKVKAILKINTFRIPSDYPSWEDLIKKFRKILPPKSPFDPKIPIDDPKRIIEFLDSLSNQELRELIEKLDPQNIEKFVEMDISKFSEESLKKIQISIKELKDFKNRIKELEKYSKKRKIINK